MREVPTFDLTIIPLWWTTDPDAQNDSIVAEANAMAADFRRPPPFYHTLPRCCQRAIGRSQCTNPSWVLASTTGGCNK